MAIEKYIENRALVWDAIKCEIRGITISYSIAQSKQQQKYINDLKLQLRELEIKLDNNEKCDWKLQFHKKRIRKIWRKNPIRYNNTVTS